MTRTVFIHTSMESKGEGAENEPETAWSSFQFLNKFGYGYADCGL